MAEPNRGRVVDYFGYADLGLKVVASAWRPFERGVAETADCRGVIVARKDFTESAGIELMTRYELHRDTLDLSLLKLGVVSGQVVFRIEVETESEPPNRWPSIEVTGIEYGGDTSNVPSFTFPKIILAGRCGVQNVGFNAVGEGVKVVRTMLSSEADIVPAVANDVVIAIGVTGAILSIEVDVHNITGETDVNWHIPTIRQPSIEGSLDRWPDGTFTGERHMDAS